MIAKEAGFSEEECSEVYFSALLHDVGKIGVPDTVINKPGKLTDEEFEKMKQHPVLGAQILSSIKQSPYLSIGAHYHHERYDGDGYPDGLVGENIPEYARIISAADSYDAMTSTRSYRNALSKEKVRSEFANEMGKQFDYKYAAIILKLMDSGKLDPLYESQNEE
jgi:HD-GYP domain-containing protein (c-di-GMP phosphodiesterase class II)